MKAWIVTHPASVESTRLADLPTPVLAPGKVLVRWRALSLNFHDYLVMSGVLPAAANRIPLSDGAGLVEAVGPEVSQWKTGDRVLSLFFPDWLDGQAEPEKSRRITGDSIDGCAAEYSVVDARSLTSLPAILSFEEGACLPCAALTAWRAISEVCQVRPGDNVLVEGSGGMALFALQFAKAVGATVYATSSSDQKLERMRALGADVCVNYRTDPGWGRTVYEISKGGVDYVIDSGGAATLNQSIDACRTGGLVVLVGVLGGIQASINLGHLFAKQQRMAAIAVGSGVMQEKMTQFIVQESIKPVIDSVHGFTELPSAVQYQLSAQHFGKIVLKGPE